MSCPTRRNVVDGIWSCHERRKTRKKKEHSSVLRSFCLLKTCVFFFFLQEHFLPYVEAVAGQLASLVNTSPHDDVRYYYGTKLQHKDNEKKV